MYNCLFFLFSTENRPSIVGCICRLPLPVLLDNISTVVHVSSCSPSDQTRAGLDRYALLSSPFGSKPIAILPNHSASLESIAINDHNFQIVTLCTDKTVRIWDIRNYKCLQVTSARGKRSARGVVQSTIVGSDQIAWHRIMSLSSWWR